MELKALLAARLEEARARSLAIVAPFDDSVLQRQHDPLMSPLVWDLAHVPNYEDLWLVRAVGGDAVRSDLDDLYDAFKQPRGIRETLPLLDPAGARAYGDVVRARALELLDEADLSDDGPEPLLRHGFVHDMVVQHEHQHAETMLAAVQLLPLGHGPTLVGPPPRTSTSPAVEPPAVEEVLVAGGASPIGSDGPWGYDNERPLHMVDLAPYWIDTAPVSNGEYQAFIDAGGYDDERWWAPAGWDWRQSAKSTAPQFWRRDGASWVCARFGVIDVVRAHEPVQHVCWYEADAFARWSGKRLPTEAEWERAAAGTEPDPARTNLVHSKLGQGQLGPAPVGSYPEGVSDVGCHQMLGDVWEWTATDFGPYPAFVAFPYDEYSAVFHGNAYKVLRGGSWATHPSACRRTFRNWDLPIRRQIFAGFRCARDAA